MSRIIDADVGLKTFCAECNHSIQCDDCDIKYHFEEFIPAVDVQEVVRCKECVFRIENKNYGKKNYLKIKGICDLDTGDIFCLGRRAENDDWFCADGIRRKDEGTTNSG